MPFRFINDHPGLPCVFLSEPGGSSAQVALFVLLHVHSHLFRDYFSVC